MVGNVKRKINSQRNNDVKQMQDFLEPALQESFLRSFFSKEYSGFIKSNSTFRKYNSKKRSVIFLKINDQILTFIDPFDFLIKNGVYAVPLEKLSSLMAYKIFYLTLYKLNAIEEPLSISLILRLIKFSGHDVYPFIVDKFDEQNLLQIYKARRHCLKCGAYLRVRKMHHGIAKGPSISGIFWWVPAYFCSVNHKKEFIRNNFIEKNKFIMRGTTFLIEQQQRIASVCKATEPIQIPISQLHANSGSEKTLWGVYSSISFNSQPISKFIAKRAMKAMHGMGISHCKTTLRNDFKHVLNNTNDEDYKSFQTLIEDSIIESLKLTKSPHNTKQYILTYKIPTLYEIFEEHLSLLVRRKTEKYNPISYQTFVLYLDQMESILLDSIRKTKMFSNLDIAELRAESLLLS